MIRTQCTGFTLSVRREHLKLYYLKLDQPRKPLTARIPVDIAVSEYVPELALFDKTIRKQRNKRGDIVLIAFYQAQPAGYLFATTKSCWVAEIEDWLITEPGEVYLYDAFTLPAYRGKRIYATLLSRAADFFGQRGYARALIFAGSHNTSSIKGIETCGFSLYGSVQRLKLLGRNVWDYRITKEYVTSHFKNET